MKQYNVTLMMEYIKILADTEEEAIERAKYEFDSSSDSQLRQRWDKVQCRELKVDSEVKE